MDEWILCYVVTYYDIEGHIYKRSVYPRALHCNVIIRVCAFCLHRKRSNSRKAAIGGSSSHSMPSTPSTATASSIVGVAAAAVAMTPETTTVAYYLGNEPIPYRSSLPGRLVTLAQFKQLIGKRGSYR